jgi:hypothetical protein
MLQNHWNYMLQPLTSALCTPTNALLMTHMHGFSNGHSPSACLAVTTSLSAGLQAYQPWVAE